MNLKVMSYQVEEWQDAIDVRLERVKQMDGTDKWAIREKGFCLNHDGEWEYEPMPSSRDDDFLWRCRFVSEQAAYSIWLGKECKSRFEHYRVRANSNSTVTPAAGEASAENPGAGE